MGDKNRIKKLRKITVQGQEYEWIARDYNNGCGLNLKIWKNKKEIFDQYMFLGQGKLTSKDVGKLIESLEKLASLKYK